MTLRRGQDRRNNNNNNNNNNTMPNHNPPPRSAHNRNPSNLAQPSDYESDAQNYYVSDSAALNGSSMATDPSEIKPPSRTNEELNLAVLQRHDPAVHSILSLAPYAVVYIFSATTQLWEKSGIEGTMFLCQLTQGELGEERYSVLVLNRRGMQNFEAKLTDGDDVEITEEYVILKVDGESNTIVSSAGTAESATVKAPDGRQSIIYGLWIFSEPPPSSTAEMRSVNAGLIKECAVHAGASRKLALERAAAERSQSEAHVHPPEESAQQDGGVPMARQLSLKELFGQQRQQDDEWSVKVHSPALRAEDSEPQFTQQNQQAGYFPQPGGWSQPIAGQFGHPVPDREPPMGSGNANASGNDVLSALFRKAYQGPPQ
ncbi:hypothetical protein FQN55_002559 [Onygenales sp. PD_40]|nr:hypothetical protein FQN55_002559 [Onygenales sp. PD_40]KAK2782900.1 hypothetical protein FQN52_000540 [Onygenales sp. PD_12]